jgi:hypothetical protein
MTNVTPALDQEVDQDTVFTIDFDETVTAAPFALGDAIPLTVLPIGQTTPVEIAFTASFDNSQSRVTLQASEPLPIGTASVSWGGLHDATGNAVSGTVARSWNVSRSARLGSDLSIKSATNAGLTTDSAGVAYLLRLQADTGDLEALRFDGTGFVPLGPVINDRPMVTNLNGAGGDNATIAVAGDGTVYVAFEQLNAAGTNIEIPVRSYDSVGNSWQDIAAPFPDNHVPASNFSARPRLTIDAANRPVLAFIDGISQALQTHRFDSGAWQSLGPVDSTVFGSEAGGCTASRGVIVTALSLTVSPDGKPGVALFCNDVFGVSLVAAEHDGTSWKLVGGPVITRQASGLGGAPVIRYAPDGSPWVAWFSANQVQVAHLDGTAFVGEVLDPAIQTYNGQVALTFLNGEPVVAGAHLFHGGRVDLRRLHDGVWEPQALIKVIGDTTTISLESSGDSVLLGQSGNDAARVTRVSFP